MKPNKSLKLTFKEYSGRTQLLNLILVLGICYSNCMPRKSRIDAPGALHNIIIVSGSVQFIGKSVIRGEKKAKAKKYSLTGK